MDKKEIINAIVSILEKVNDKNVLQEMKNLINGVFKHYISGNWER